VWQFERNPKSAIGGNGDGAAADCGAGSLELLVDTSTSLVVVPGE
jgi:hypothetical protein